MEPLVFSPIAGGSFRRGDTIEAGEPVLVERDQNPELYDRILTLAKEPA